jgi:hypothetical protein
MQSAMDEKKKLELRVDNITGELNKTKAQAAELEGSKQQLQVGCMGHALHWIPSYLLAADMTAMR